MFFRPINMEIKTSMKAETAKFYTTFFIAIAAAIVFMTGCAETKGNANHTSSVPPSEGAIGNPSVTVLGLDGVSGQKRDKFAEIARQYAGKHLEWADKAVYVVRRRHVPDWYGSGWCVDVYRVTRHDASGRQIVDPEQKRTLVLNRKEHIVDFYSPGGPSGP